MNKEKIGKILIILLITIAIAGVAIFYWQKKDDAEKGKITGQPDSEEERLKNENNEAVENGENEKVEKVKPISDEDHIIGDKNASVQVIVYSDFECPYCARFAETLKQIENKFGDKVVIAFRHFPLDSHPYALSAAIASECAAEEGKFWEMHDKLFADNVAGKMSAEQFKKDAADLGLDITKFNLCLEEKKYENKINEQAKSGEAAGIIGTPTIFVNGEIIPGAYPFEDFTDSAGLEREGMKSIIERHLK